VTRSGVDGPEIFAGAGRPRYPLSPPSEIPELPGLSPVGREEGTGRFILDAAHPRRYTPREKETRMPSRSYPELQEMYGGQFVALRDGEVVVAGKTYRDLLEVFFTVHDPTQLNRQGPDVGTQYRSAIFPHTPEQEAEARAVVEELSRDSVYDLPIVTTVEPNATFWPAESNHDRYYRRHPFQPYCLAVIAPKVAKLRAKHTDKLRD